MARVHGRARRPHHQEVPGMLERNSHRRQALRPLLRACRVAAPQPRARARVARCRRLYQRTGLSTSATAARAAPARAASEPYNDLTVEQCARNAQIVSLRRPRLLWMVLGAMLLVSVVPLGLYHRQVLRLSQEKLTDTESVQQTEVTRSRRRRDPALRRQPLPAAHQRTPNPGAHRACSTRSTTRCARRRSRACSKISSPATPTVST